ncbi:cytochrome c prime [Methylobacterium sp. 4-46]|nr:cytochrome c prime [Methylobacterium sp. 4-46]
MTQETVLKRVLVALLLSVFGSCLAQAQNLYAIDARKKILKSFGDVTKPVAGILKGEAPFDIAPVKTALATYAEGARKLPDLFPEDSKSGRDTEALPAIWSHKDDVAARFTKLAADSTSALGSITDQASFAATMPKVVAQCGACHKEYRLKK